jgi:hypothetical protein
MSEDISSVLTTVTGNRVVTGPKKENCIKTMGITGKRLNEISARLEHSS